MKVTVEKVVCDVCGIELKRNNSPINQNIQIRDKNLCLRCGGIMLDRIIKDKVEISDEMIESVKEFYARNKNIAYV